MTTQLLIYGRATPVNKQKHKNWSVKTGADYRFTQQINSVPLTAVEFPSAAAEYSIVFAGSGDEVMPTAILGLRDKENLYVQEGGVWDAKYIPAFVRRYPFVFSSDADGSTFTLCIDEDFSGCNQTGRGEKLFDADEEMTQYLKNVLNFSKEYQGQYKRSQAFCTTLQKLNLLEPMKAQITYKTGEKGNLGGFLVVSRTRLKALTDQQLLGLAKTDELELIYLHLQSLRNFSAMVDRVVIAKVH